jgi:hypothetical protein
MDSSAAFPEFSVCLFVRSMPNARDIIAIDGCRRDHTGDATTVFVPFDHRWKPARDS